MFRELIFLWVCSSSKQSFDSLYQETGVLLHDQAWQGFSQLTCRTSRHLTWQDFSLPILEDKVWETAEGKVKGFNESTRTRSTVIGYPYSLPYSRAWAKDSIYSSYHLPDSSWHFPNIAQGTARPTGTMRKISLFPYKAGFHLQRWSQLYTFGIIYSDTSYVYVSVMPYIRLICYQAPYFWGGP